MKKILVLIATYNGEKYIEEQLVSILNQKNVEVDILISDDSSTDNTLNIIKQYISNNRIKIISGKFGSPQKNFYNLINNADIEDYDYFALSDQDDVWMEEKLEKAIEKISNYDNTTPVIYYGSAIKVDEKLNKLKSNYVGYEVKEISEVLVASTAQGCTIVMNKKLMMLLRNNETSTDMMHDGWIHKTCLILNGVSIFDPVPYMYYRIHNSNAFISRNKRIINILKFIFDNRNKGVLTKVINEWEKNFPHIIRYDTQKLFDKIKDKSFKGRLNVFFSKKFSSKHKLFNIRFKIQCLLGNL